ncbi:hypothetical protein HWV62_44309 [Athelia sp. TMB]|nr:hypothetical protein HWV62_44309 [Athelia sp. TMB]
MSQSFLLTIHSVDDLSWPSSLYSKYRSRLKPHLFVEIYVGQTRIDRSKTVKKSLEPKWDKIFTIPSQQESSDLVIMLKHESSFPNDPCIGTVKTTLGELLRQSEGLEVAHLKLEHGPKKKRYHADGFITASIEIAGEAQARENVLLNAQRDLQGLRAESPALAPSIPSAVEDFANTIIESDDVLKSLGAILEKIKCIADATVGVVDTLAKVHPYADTAWTVLSSLYKRISETFIRIDILEQAYQHQKETDAAVLGLFKKMIDLYSFVGDVESLQEKIQRLNAVLIRVLEQTTECGIFFREYTSHGFAKRFMGQAVSNRSQKITGLSATLSQLKEDVMSALQLHTASVASKTAFVSSQIKEGVDRLGACSDFELRELKD